MHKITNLNKNIFKLCIFICISLVVFLLISILIKLYTHIIYFFLYTGYRIEAGGNFTKGPKRSIHKNHLVQHMSDQMYPHFTSLIFSGFILSFFTQTSHLKVIQFFIILLSKGSTFNTSSTILLVAHGQVRNVQTIWRSANLSKTSA